MALRDRRVLQHLWAWRKFIILLVTPMVTAPILVIGTPESKCAFTVMVMVVYWFTEAIPMGVTALLPVVFFPLLDIVASSKISRLYMTDTNMMLFGGMLVAVSIEYWDIHKIIALRTLMVFGTSPRWLMLGQMLATWFLSMWISNMATTAMMIPITEAVLQQLEDCDAVRAGKKSSGGSPGKDGSDKNGSYDAVLYDDSDLENDVAETALQNEDANQSVVIVRADPDKRKKSTDFDEEEADSNVQSESSSSNFKGLAKAMTLCVAYASNIGGTATLTGTGPNLFMKGNTDSICKAKNLDNPITFGAWMAFAVPLSFIILIICWLWLQIAFFDRSCCNMRQGKRQDPEASRRVKQLIEGEYRKLGPLVFGQVMVMGLFALLVTLWVTRDLAGVVGWGNHFKSVSNTLPGILVGILMFILPATLPCLGSYDNYSHPEKSNGGALEGPDQTGKVNIRPLMTWQFMNRKMPWQLMLLLGGGFALSEGFVASGLSVWIGDQLYFFGKWNEWLVLLVFCFITASATEVASNNAICSVLLPIMEELAPRIGIHPLLLAIPVTLSCSFAFMLPVATPPNAIVFTYGRLATMDMAKTGFVVNLVAVPFTVLLTKTLAVAVFDLGSIPQEFLNNATSIIAEFP